MKFKGWSVPGTHHLKNLNEAVKLGENESLDFISGNFRIYQLKDGHRFSTDDVLTAWYGSLCVPSPERVLDLGSGIGSVATMAAFRFPGAKFVTVEAQTESVELAKKSVALNGLSNRFEVRQGDFRHQALSENEKFDLILGSPPYFALEEGIQSEHPQKTACRFELRGDISDYAKAAARHLAPGGVFVAVFPVQPGFQRERAMKAGETFGLVLTRYREVEFREGEGAFLGLFCWMNCEDLPEADRRLLLKEPLLTVRQRDGNVSDEYKTVKLVMGFRP